MSSYVVRFTADGREYESAEFNTLHGAIVMLGTIAYRDSVEAPRVMQR